MLNELNIIETMINEPKTKSIVEAMMKKSVQ